MSSRERRWISVGARALSVPRALTRHRTHGRLEQTLEGPKAQESTDRAISHPGQGEVARERTLEESKASKRACRPPPGEPGAYENDGAVDAPPGANLARLAITGNHRRCPGVLRTFG